MKDRGVHLEYRFVPRGQRGADVHNPLFELLSAVAEHGSIQHAARALGASYRHVWGSCRQWEAELGEPLLVWSKGQPARLTPFAQRLLWAEKRARSRLVPHIEALRAELERVLAEALDGQQLLLSIHASHDLALPLLRELAATAAEGERLHVELKFAGSMDALRALAEGRCTVAGFHVPPLADEQRLFARELKPLLEPGRHKLIGCMQRRQGLLVAPGNPLALHSMADVVARAARFVDRQPGSGTRLLADHLLAEAGLAPERLRAALPAAEVNPIAGAAAAAATEDSHLAVAAAVAGTEDSHLAVAAAVAGTEDSHLAVAAAVAAGAGDVALGIEAAARSFGLDFVPLVTEDYYLVCLSDLLDQPAVRALRRVLQGPAWAQALQGLGGYGTAHAGEVLSLTRALPWWRFRRPKTAATSVER